MRPSAILFLNLSICEVGLVRRYSLTTQDVTLLSQHNVSDNPLLVDVDRYRGLIQARAEEALGREVGGVARRLGEDRLRTETAGLEPAPQPRPLTAESTARRRRIDDDLHPATLAGTA